MLDAARWERVCDLVHEALQAPEAVRFSLLEDIRDAEVRAEAASLLAAHTSAGDSFLAGDALSHGVAEDLTSEWIGQRIGPYRVAEELGHGGMGTVFLAARADDLYERRVAIKVVRADLEGELFLSRFREEIRILAGFDHPAIARLLDAGITAGGSPYLVMEYVQGVRIDTFCHDRECTAVEIVGLAIQIADAVHYAHELGVVHQDLKPGNILVTPDGRPKLLDFGIAQISAESRSHEDGPAAEFRAWTPAYASPEQVSGWTITLRSDVFSLGTLLYFLLTDQPPYCFECSSPEEMRDAFETTSPVIPSRVQRRIGRMPSLVALDPVLLKALRVSPENRYLSAKDMADDLRRALAGHRTAAQMPSPLERWKRGLQRSADWLAVAGCIAICYLIATCHSLIP